MHRISAWCDVENIASSRVMEKIGMKREGRLRDYRMQGGKWRDSFPYSILDYEWSSMKADKTGKL
jgi:RimJ/RimL family protein N-acetyltransferase